MYIWMHRADAVYMRSDRVYAGCFLWDATMKKMDLSIFCKYMNVKKDMQGKVKSEKKWLETEQIKRL